MRPRRVVLIACLVVAGLLIADLVYSGVAVRHHLGRSAGILQQASQEMRRAPLEVTRDRLERAQLHAQHADSVTRGPALTLAGLVPRAGRVIDATRALSRALANVSEGGVVLVEDARSLSQTPEGVLSTLFSRGRVGTGAATTLAGGVRRSIDRWREGLAAIRRSPDPDVRQLDVGLRRLEREVERGLGELRRAATALELVPAAAGGDGVRKYLLAFQTPSEARGGGGLVGLYGTLVVEGGVLDLTSVHSIRPLTYIPIEPVSAPDWFKRHYGPFQATRQWQQATLSPDFETVGSVLLQMFEASTGERFDGVLAMDPIALQHLLGVLGPLRPEGFDLQLDGSNAADIILGRAYVEFGQSPRQTRFLSATVEAFWERITRSDIDAVALLEALTLAAEGGHFKMYLERPEEEDALKTLDLDASLADVGPHVQLLFHNNVSLSKVDYYLQRGFHTRVELEDDGDALITTTINLLNEAETERRSPLVEPGFPGDPRGLNRMHLNLLLPEGAQLQRFASGGRRAEPFLERDRDNPVVWDVVEVPPGEEREVAVTYRVPGMVSLADGVATFRLKLIPQATVTPDRYSVLVVPPPGYRVSGAAGPLGPEGGLATFGRLLGETDIRVDLVRAP